MSLKTDYLEGANGFTQKMAAVFTAGQTLVTDNLATLQSELQANAAKGLKTFTVNVITTFEPANLRLEGTHLDTYLSGISSQLMVEEIYDYEVELKLNTSDLTTTSIDFNFTF